MIEYVDRLLVHWAQEFSVRDGGINLGHRAGWTVGALTEPSGRSGRTLTARGVASRPTSARSGVGKVAERVNQSVELLPESLQRAVRLHYLEQSGLPALQKADILGVSLRTFHRLIHRSHESISDDLPKSYVHWKLFSPQGVRNPK